MNIENDTALIILVVEDVEETRDGIEKLLKVDGYRVEAMRDEPSAITSALRRRPDLILVSLPGILADIIVTACRIRERAGLGESVPVVLFCVAEVGEGDEVAIGRNVHVTRPDNFNQLRNLITRLLLKTELPAVAGGFAPLAA
jgi:CheY-like chemotaxis protein